mmetsp:Transcript_16523/g.30042  ORF Transcript_16523/g.30042 Transcript_16523/m.30042 type:complete len:83 (-) Transcript_16523:205-453(-)
MVRSLTSPSPSICFSYALSLSILWKSLRHGALELFPHPNAYFHSIYGHASRHVNSPSACGKMRDQHHHGATLGNDSVPNNSL